MKKDDIAIIGMSGRFAQANNLEQFRVILKNGIDCVRDVPEDRKEILNLEKNENYLEMGYLETISNFDNSFFNISRKEALAMSPEQKLGLEVAAETILSSGYTLSRFRGKNCSVIVSSSDNQYQYLLKKRDGLSYLGSLISMLSGKISYYFDLRGPNLILDTGCSSSLVGVHEGCMKIINGESDYSLVGGISINLLFPKSTDVEERDVLGIGSNNGRCKSFDSEADGTGLGEGVGFVLLKSLKQAQEDKDYIYGVIKGSAVNSDGDRCNSITTPSVQGQEEVIKKAWENINVNDITEIEAHGTGTIIGDPIEFSSVSECLQRRNCKTKVLLGSVKSNIGHLGHAAGIASLIKVLISFKYNESYPLVHFKRPNPYMDFKNSMLEIGTKYKKYDIDSKRLIGINSFSLNGTNAHIILENYSNFKNIEEKEEKNKFIKLSAKSKISFQNYVNNLYSFLNDTEEDINNIVYSINTGIDDSKYRNLIEFKDGQDLKEKLRIVDGIFNDDSTKKDIHMIFIKDYDLTDEIEVLKIVHKFKKFMDLNIKIKHFLVDDVGKAFLDHSRNKISTKELIEVIKAKPIKKDTAKLNETVQRLLTNQESLFVNFSKNKVLNVENQSKKFKEFLIRGKENYNNFLYEAYISGEKIDWDNYYMGENYFKIPTPLYPFEKVNNWGELNQQLDIFNDKTIKENLTRDNLKQDIDFQNINDLLKDIWRDVLEFDGEIKDNDDFFELGGSSLLIAMLVEQIEEKLGVEIEIDEVYEYGDFKEFREYVEQRVAGNK